MGTIDIVISIIALLFLGGTFMIALLTYISKEKK